MRVLIDTHILLWFLEGNALLRTIHKQTIIDGGNEVSVSIASLWELAIKSSLGRLQLKETLPRICDRLDQESIGILPIDVPSVLRSGSLPFHHRDPFDRIIIAQALEGDLSIITVDTEFTAYGAKLI